MKKRLLALLMMVSLLVMGTLSVAQAQAIEIVVPHYKSGENVGAVLFLAHVERFNAANEGKYHVVIEELTQDMYVDKIKQLGQQGKLPPLIEGGERDWIEQVVIPGGLFEDLMPMVNENPELAALLLPDMTSFNTTEDGKLFSIQTPVVRPMGMFYNAEMAELTSEPGEYADWDAFLADFGENKMAFMTGENAWTTALTYSSLIAQEEGGADILRGGLETKIFDFTGEVWVNAATKLQNLLQNYASGNTIGAVYADAANAFMSRNAAAISNGPWMTGDFAPDASDKWSNDFDGEQVRSAVFPGNIALANTNGYQWWIPASATDAEKECAKAFIAFLCSPAEVEAAILAEGGTCPTLTPSEEFLTALSENRLVLEYVNSINEDTLIVPHFADCIPSSVAETEFGKLLPKLIDGSISPEDFCAELTAKAAETALD